jgi:hypothetical protein
MAVREMVWGARGSFRRDPGAPEELRRIMPIPSLNALLPEVSGRMLRTVAQSVNTRNFLVALGVIAGCVINGTR